MSSSLDKLEGLLDSFELADYDLRDAELDEDLSYSSARAAQAAYQLADVDLGRVARLILLSCHCRYSIDPST
jgi:hypothetical protein